jgi:hypothetical protein
MIIQLRNYKGKLSLIILLALRKYFIQFRKGDSLAQNIVNLFHQFKTMIDWYL